MKNILIPLELNHSSLENNMVTTAISFAKEIKAKCWLIHVSEPKSEYLDLGAGPQYIRDIIAKDLRNEHRYIQAVAEQFEEHKMDVEGLLIQGATAEMIREEIDKLEIDLLILGNKKHSFTNILFKGSVTEELMNEVNIPILLIPDNE